MNLVLHKVKKSKFQFESRRQNGEFIKKTCNLDTSKIKQKNLLKSHLESTNFDLNY